MNKKRYQPKPIPTSEITPEHIYFTRRSFLKSVGALSLGAFLAACSVNPPQSQSRDEENFALAPTSIAGQEALTPYEAVTNYNNYYEFTTNKTAVAKMTENLRTSPWDVEVGGLVHKSRRFGLEDLRKLFQPKERIYRLRCAEGWSMVIPGSVFRSPAC